jgi:hypothetical protein
MGAVTLDSMRNSQIVQDFNFKFWCNRTAQTEEYGLKYSKKNIKVQSIC